MKIHRAYLLLILAGLAPTALLQSCGSSNSPTTPPVPTNTPSGALSPTPSFTTTASGTATNSPTNSPTSTPTKTPTATLTNTPANTATSTSTSTATNSSTPTSTGTPTYTPTKTPTPTNTGTPTNSPTVTATTCANYGQTSNTGISTGNSGYYYTNQVSVGQTTVMDSISLESQDNNASNETVYVALYDLGTGNLKFSGSFTINLGMGTTVVTVPVSPAVTLPAATYNLTVCVPTASTNCGLGNASGLVNFDFGTYAGGAPPANYSTLQANSAYLGSYYSVLGTTFFFHACP